jgi:choline dehydrogenase-like flavoprotein
MAAKLSALMANGSSGAELRDEVARDWRRTLLIDVGFDSEPDRRAAVELSRSKDRFGLPRNRLLIRPLGGYERRALRHLLDDLPRRLAPLGLEQLQLVSEPLALHLAGTLRAGTDPDAVVDAELRHRRVENLFACGAAVFPTYTPTPPTLTIAALSIRLGARLGA